MYAGAPACLWDILSQARKTAVFLLTVDTGGNNQKIAGVGPEPAAGHGDKRAVLSRSAACRLLRGI